MDSDDEDDHRMVEDRDAFFKRRSGRFLHLKVEAKEINDTLRRMQSDLPQICERPCPEDIEAVRRGYHANLSYHHVRRLFSSMRGFHIGYLDLSGRHPARYKRVRARFDEIVQDFHYAVSHCRTTTERVGIQTDENGAMLYYDAHIYTFDPPGLWEDLAPKWGLRSMMGFEGFSSLLESYMNLLCPRYPYPKFQQLKLLDLPAELLDRILCVSNLEDLQKWSVVCKLLRELALVYVYKDYDYDLKAYPLDHDFIETIPKDEDYQDRFDEYLQSFALERRDELAGRMRRVLQRPDILSSVRRLGFNESWSMSNLLPSIGFTYAEYVAPVMPLLAGHIRSSSLSKLHFMTLYLYRSVWEAMAGSRSLHTATLYTAKATEDEGAQWQVPFVLPVTEKFWTSRSNFTCTYSLGWIR